MHLTPWVHFRILICKNKMPTVKTTSYYLVTIINFTLLEDLATSWLFTP